MSLLSPLLTRLKLPLAGAGSFGWIGVDIGTRLIKLAQVERLATGWQLAGHWIIGDEDDPPVSSELLRTQGLAHCGAQIKNSRNMFRGRIAGVTIPTACVGLRALELPTSPRHELLSMVQQELAAEDTTSEHELDFDVWETQTGSGVSKVIAVSSERALTTKIASDLLGAGIHCRIMDSVPCAAARAVRLCDPAASQETVAALDFGDSGAMLTVVHGDLPVFCRVLRNSGLEPLIQRLQEKLGVRRSECRRLLTRHGVSSGAGTETAATIHRIVSAPLEQLVEELRRTLQFIGLQSSQWAPKRLWLMGGGAMIRNLPDFLTTRAGLPTAPWTLGANGGHDSDNFDPLYAVATGLSLLAWETDQCT